VQAERDIRARIGEQSLDFAAMAAVSNIYRAANVIRNHMERKVLADEDLSWAAFTVLFVLWIWGDQQTRHLAEDGRGHQGDADRRAQDPGEARAGSAARARRGRAARAGRARA